LLFVVVVCLFNNGRLETLPITRPIWTSDLEKHCFQILDTYREIYTWKGPDVPGSLDIYAKDWLEQYAQQAAALRGGDVPIISVTPFKEPKHFTRHFHAWFRPITSEDELEARRQKTIERLTFDHQKEMDALAAAQQKAADEANVVRMQEKEKKRLLEEEEERQKAEKRLSQRLQSNSIPNLSTYMNNDADNSADTRTT